MTIETRVKFAETNSKKERAAMFHELFRGFRLGRSFHLLPGRMSILPSPRVFMCGLMALFLLFATAFIGTAAAANSEQDKLTKLAPDPVSVRVENGVGSLNLVFILKAGSGVPAFKVTSAAGGATAIPETDIAFGWSATPSPDQSATRTLLTAHLKVDTHTYLEPGVEYKGRIIFLWPDSEQWIDFSVVDQTSLGFELSEAKLDLVVGSNQPSGVRLRVKNTGKAEIQKLSFSSLDLSDRETQHRVTMQATEKDFQSDPIRPLQEREVLILLPSPELAGSYTGTLDVVANGSTRKSIPIVIRARGPLTTRGYTFLPFLLFIGTLASGFWLSTKLEDWFNLGGLQRAQALLTLQQSERALARLLDQLGSWEKDLSAEVFVRTKLRLRQSLAELRGDLGNYSEMAQEQLVAEAQRYANAQAQGTLWSGFVQTALKQWDAETQKEKLKQVLISLDAAPPLADLNAYRESLRTLLVAGAGEEEHGASMTLIDERLPTAPPPADLKARIKLMSRLQRIVVMVVVFICAYQIFYVSHFAFGTLLDYLGVFLWTLGLTQTGSQIMARAHSTYNPPAKTA
jgi:hypothetical protein